MIYGISVCEIMFMLVYVVLVVVCLGFFGGLVVFGVCVFLLRLSMIGLN